MAKSKTTTTTTNLNDLQRVLLATACQREDGNLLPVAAGVGGKPDAVRRAIAALLKRALVAESDAAAAEQVWREERDRRFGIAITDAGRAAIDGTAADAAVELAGTPTAPQTATTPRPASKTAQVVALLQREDGATLIELVAATGWLPHTTRAALTGLRKKGHAIARDKRGEATCYRIVAAA